MSVTVEKFQNLVGGEFVDAVEGGTMEANNRRPARRSPRCRGDTGRRRPRGGSAKKALPEWRETTPAERPSSCSTWRT